MNKNRAFSLIELLVTMAIICVLSAILFPSFVKVRDKAHQLSCLSNEMMLGHAVVQYTQDYDEHYPPADTTASFGDTVSGSGWIGALLPYFNNTSLLHCPRDTQKTYINAQDQVVTAVSYTYNWNLSAPGSGQLSASEGALTVPARTILLCEWHGASVILRHPQPWTIPAANGVESLGAGHYVTGPLGGRSNTNSFYDTGRFPSGSERHSLGSNFVMADGHVKWLYGREVSSGVTAENSTDDELAAGTAAGAGFLGTSRMTGRPFVATFSPK